MAVQIEKCIAVTSNFEHCFITLYCSHHEKTPSEATQRVVGRGRHTLSCDGCRLYAVRCGAPGSGRKPDVASRPLASRTRTTIAPRRIRLSASRSLGTDWAKAAFCAYKAAKAILADYGAG